MEIKLSTCGANCLKLDSSLTDHSYRLRINPQLSSPVQQGSTLFVPSLKQIENSVIRRWLIGHELHPYTSSSFQTALFRPSQQIAVNDFKEALHQGYSSFLHVSPTSTGKSLVLAKNLLEKLKNKSSKKLSFISVDKIKLVNQLHSEIKATAGDFNLKQIHWKAKEKENFAEQISQALKEEKPTVISLTLKSFMIQMEKLREKDPFMYSRALKNIDGIYIDEAHHLGAVQTNRFVLDLVKNSQAFLYGATATPVHKDFEIQALFEKVHWSYLEEKNFFPPSMVIDQLSLSIKKGDITPFNDIYLVLSEKLVSANESPFFIQDSNLFSINPEYYARLNEFLSVIFDSNKKGMIIVSKIKEAEELAQFLNKEQLGISFEAYHSGMSAESRELVLRNSREEESHYIIAVRALDEGINLPHLSAYIDLNPHISVKQIVHRIGRVLRPSLNKLEADIFILSSYKDSERIRELMDRVGLIREQSLKSDKLYSLRRQILKDLSKESYEFFLKQEKFWPVKKEFPNFESAKKIVQKAGIKTGSEYREKYKKLALPARPSITYKDRGWKGWKNFLGTSFPVYKKAQQIIENAKITTLSEYQKKHAEWGLPYKPNITYKEEWQSWGVFLGTGRTREKNFPSYKKAEKIVQDTKIKTSLEYKERYRELALPANPNIAYKNRGWQSWGIFLGTGRTREKNFPSYRKAEKIVQDAKIKTSSEYRERYRELALPASPHKTYKEEWQAWGAFLGTKSK